MAFSLVGTEPTKNAQELFLRANKQYHAKKFEKAKKLYESIDPKGRAVWYNIGNCNYQMKQYPEAIVCWRRAQKNSTYAENKDIELNIAHAKEQEGVSSQHAHWHTLLRASGAPFPFIAIQLMLVLLWFCLFGLLFIYKGPKNSYFILKVVILLIAIAWLSSLVILEYYNQRYEHAIVKKATPVYAGPDDRYHVVGNLLPAQELDLIEKRTGWYKIKNEHEYGWVPLRTVSSV